MRFYAMYASMSRRWTDCLCICLYLGRKLRSLTLHVVQGRAYQRLYGGFSVGGFLLRRVLLLRALPDTVTASIVRIFDSTKADENVRKE